ncbi:preprotein translocase subunit SecE [Chloroflexota bacterium]
MARPTGSSILRRPSPGEAGRRGGLFQFFGEVVSELKKVTWPTRAETVRLTLLVIAVSVSIGIVLGLIDMLFTRLFDQFLF